MNIKTATIGLSTLLVKRYSGPFWLRRKQLSKTQWLDQPALNELQLDRLRRLLRHCHTTIPYYREQMNELGINVDKIMTVDDVKAFPIQTKQQVLDAGSDLISSKYPRCLCRKAYTGGTTGTPMALVRDLFSISNEHAFVRRQYDWAGIHMSDRCAFLTGRLIAKPDQNKRLYAYDPIMKELILSTYHLSPQTAESYANAIHEYNAKALIGYPSAVYLLAQMCLNGSQRINLSAVLTSSEVLTGSMRKTIETAFNCNVFDFYGSAERVCYIHTCESGSYHIVPEYGLTELIPVDENEPRRCRVVATGFWNLAMPLLRYDLSDIVTKTDRQCTCGRSFPVIEKIMGRQGDSIVTKSGRQFGTAILTHLLYGTDNILESQIIQDAVDHVWIDFVPTQRFSAENRMAFEKLIKQHLPSELHVEFRAVEAVKRTTNGKIRPVVSLLN